ncbi:MAG: hypothetical protein OJJ21_06220 [Ferrovibrio sp.]|uniref:hypothetical protein n=1 Tax=Ferrovibrio sp. TaxID=1917215 RepID=UPI002634EE10|nr:hypothetical protein [Ferrovibrio sp.]MCW0233177.1 hypothetical protein [Ferrovibrio sp.]
MWNRSGQRPNQTENQATEVRAIASSGSAPRKSVTPKDNERIEKILASIAIDTSQTFNAMLDSLMGERPVTHHESNQTREFICTVFDEIRMESNRDAVILARKFADMCMRAADQLNDNHQRTVARCVSELFEQFAAKLDHREPANSN